MKRLQLWLRHRYDTPDMGNIVVVGNVTDIVEDEFLMRKNASE